MGLNQRTPSPLQDLYWSMKPNGRFGVYHNNTEIEEFELAAEAAQFYEEMLEAAEDADYA